MVSKKFSFLLFLGNFLFHITREINKEAKLLHAFNIWKQQDSENRAWSHKYNVYMDTGLWFEEQFSILLCFEESDTKRGSCCTLLNFQGPGDRAHVHMDTKLRFKSRGVFCYIFKILLHLRTVAVLEKSSSINTTRGWLTCHDEKAGQPSSISARSFLF